MHPELEDAIQNGVPIPEVIQIFQIHHSGRTEDYIHGDDEEFQRLVHSDSAFWDNWKSYLVLGLDRMSRASKPIPIQSPFLNIYKDLTREITSWLCDSKRKNNVYMIAEPRARYPIGIPTRADVLASICSDADRLGAQTTCYLNVVLAKLAARYPLYRRLLAEQLADNPGILEAPPLTYFKKLIHEPWRSLQISHPQYVGEPPVVFLYWDTDYPEALLDSIVNLSSPSYSLPILWIILIDSTRRLPICNLLDPITPFEYVRIPVCYDDGPKDAALILHHLFPTSLPRWKRKEMLHNDKKWPSNEQMFHLIRITSGVIESIDAVIKFVNREDGGGPEAHLDTFLAYMIDSPSPSDEQPCCALDHFYTRAFSNIPPHNRLIASQVLGIIYHSIYFGKVTPLQITCLLSAVNINVPDIYAYLSGWAIVVNKGHHAASDSFRAFLKEPKRSGRVWHSPRSIVFEAFLHFLSHSSNLLGFMESKVKSIPANSCTYNELERLRHMVSQLFYAPDTASRKALLECVLILRFDFRCLAYTCDNVNARDFMHFLMDLHELDKLNSPNIVRVQPESPLDCQFIDMCQGLAEPLDLKNQDRLFSPKYLLLGLEDETVLVIFENAGEIYKERQYWRVDTYTSTMFDFM